MRERGSNPATPNIPPAFQCEGGFPEASCSAKYHAIGEAVTKAANTSLRKSEVNVIPEMLAQHFPNANFFGALFGGVSSKRINRDRQSEWR
jgi:hypothetical protein